LIQLLQFLRFHLIKIHAKLDTTVKQEAHPPQRVCARRDHTVVVNTTMIQLVLSALPATTVTQMDKLILLKCVKKDFIVLLEANRQDKNVEEQCNVQKVLLTNNIANLGTTIMKLDKKPANYARMGNSAIHEKTVHCRVRKVLHAKCSVKANLSRSVQRDRTRSEMETVSVSIVLLVNTVMVPNLGIRQAIALVDSFVPVADLLNIHLMFHLTFQVVFQIQHLLNAKRVISVTERDKRLVTQELTCRTLKQRNAILVQLVMHVIQQVSLTLKQKPANLDTSAMV